MNIHKYLLPASLAATIHVALLWFLPVEPYARLIEIPLVGDPPPPKPPEVALPPEDRVASTEPVKSLSGGPTPPEIDEPLIRPLKEDFTLPADDRFKNPSRELKMVPEKFGPGDMTGIGEVGVSGAGIFTIEKLDRAPRATVQLPPEYPYAMKRSGTSGSVLVEFDVNAE